MLLTRKTISRGRAKSTTLSCGPAMVSPVHFPAMRYITEPARRLPLRESYDVVVVGGGVAGVAAAVAAQREGATVCLLEKEYALGGLATLGNVIVYLPLCDGEGKQVSAGLAETMLKLSVADGRRLIPGHKPIPDCWSGEGTIQERTKQRYVCCFNPASYARAMEEWVVQLAIDLRYDARFSGVKMTRGQVSAVVIEDKAGRSAIGCRAVVDATGDADVCMAAGEEIDTCDVNVPCGWFYFLNVNGQAELCPHSSDYDFGAKVLPSNIKKGFACTDSRDVTAMVLASNRVMDQRLADIRKERNADADTFRLPSIPSYRMTRRLVGQYELALADDHRWFADTVGLIGHWRERGPVYAVPLRSLIGKTPNLITAGRCVSSARDGWDLTRVIPACAVTGEAAGMASAMIARSSRPDFGELDLTALQEQLRRHKVILDERLCRAAADESPVTQSIAGRTTRA